MKVYLATIARLENNYIKEFVEYYYSIGIDKILLFDNNYDGEENFNDVIKTYIDSGFVKLIDYRNKSVCQLESYNEAYTKYGDECDWICFFDADEFIMFDNKYKNIKDFLSDSIFNEYDGIRLCWKNFDDNNLIKVENNDYNCLSRFKHIHSHTHCKSLFKTKNKYVDFSNIKISDAHGCYDEHLRMCSSDGNVCNNTNFDIGPTSIYANAWLNHYRYKTIDEFIRFKLLRGYPDQKYEYTIEKGFSIDTFFYCNSKTPEKLEYIKSLGIDYEYK